MHAFQDQQGRTWEIVVNVGTARRVRDLLKVDILKLYGEEAERVFCDPVLLVDVLYVLCQAQCQHKNISDYDFGAGLVGESLERAASALMDEVADFFPQAKAQLLRQIKTKGETAATKMLEAAAEMIERFDATSGASSTA